MMGAAAAIPKPRAKPPPWRFLWQHPAHLVACGFGSGLSPVAPGTAGTLFAWATYQGLERVLSGPWLMSFFFLAFLYGILACERTGRDLGLVDHGSIVWDEVVPFWIVLALTPSSWAWQLGAFVVFRGFDILKPPPASYFDRQVKNGFGVMMDDMVAAAYSVMTLLLVEKVLETIPAK